MDVSHEGITGAASLCKTPQPARIAQARLDERRLSSRTWNNIRPCRPNKRRKSVGSFKQTGKKRVEGGRPSSQG